MRVFFAYDNEDWCTPRSDDIVKRLAEIHERHGATASFYTVAERARALRHRGRRDVIEALARHEIAYHGDTHGHFPRPMAVYCEELGWEGGLAELLRIEGRGVQDVCDIFDQLPVTWCQGECNWSPQAVYGLRLLGIGSWTGSLYGTPDGMPVWYMGQLSVRRAMHVVSVQPDSADEDLLARLQADFDRRMEEKGGEGFIYVFGHPCRWGSERWYGQEQWADFRAGRITEPCQLQPPAEQYSDSQVERLLEQTERCIEWVMSRDDLTPTTYADLNAACNEPSLQWLPLEELSGALSGVGETFDWAQAAGTALAPADLLAGVAWALARTTGDGSLPGLIPVRRPLGPVTEPFACDESGRVARSAVLQACRAIDAEIERTSAIPSSVRLGGSPLGPADILRLSAAALADSAAEWLRLQPGPALPEIANAKCFQETRANSWSFPEGFESSRMFDLAKWQSWSFRPAVMRW
jgi:hypothetical protein